MDESAGEEGEDESDEGGDDDDEDKPKVVKRRKRVAEEEEDEAPEPLESQPSVIPRLINCRDRAGADQAQLRLRSGDAAGRHRASGSAISSRSKPSRW